MSQRKNLNRVLFYVYVVTGTTFYKGKGGFKKDLIPKDLVHRSIFITTFFYSNTTWTIIFDNYASMIVQNNERQQKLRIVVQVL